MRVAVGINMRWHLMSCVLCKMLCGAAGFMMSFPSTTCRASIWTGGASPQAMTTGARRHSLACRAPLPTSDNLRRWGLHMSREDKAAGAGGSEGAPLAEAKIIVRGQATGGYFRAHARNEAHFNRKLCGALKEIGRGETEIMVEGRTSAIRSFVRWCKKGPGLSQRIEDVTVDWSEYTGLFDGFEVFAEGSASNNPAGVS